MKTRQLSPNSIKPYKNNPRDNRKAIEAVKVSIAEFGFNQPIVVDKNKVIVVGHTRREAAIELGLQKVPVIVADHLTPEKARRYRLADNRTNENAYWIEDKLAEELLKVDPKKRASTGFSEDELSELMADLDEAVPVKPKVEFSQELLESRNYVVLYFDNDVDWLAAKTHFKMKSVASKRANGKPWATGIGRVIDGAKYLKRLGNG